MCACPQVELKVTGIRCISRAAPLPFEVIDASASAETIRKRTEAGEAVVAVGQDVRLDGRYVDLRTPANQAIFRVQSAVCQVGRRSLICVQSSLARPAPWLPKCS